MSRRVLALACAVCLPLAAEANDWDGTLYLQHASYGLRGDSVLNPGNRVAQLPEAESRAELRLNLHAGNERLQVSARPIATYRALAGTNSSEEGGKLYFSQWQVRLQAGESWRLSGGREVMHWGAGQFRSPASPFYFDNGRRDPLRELSGIDHVKIAWTPDRQHSLSLARLIAPAPGVASGEGWQDGWLGKYDWRGEAATFGTVAASAPARTPFFGLHGQATVDDAILVYVEIGSARRAPQLVSDADASQPFAIATESPRRTTTLIGGSYTFEDGQTLTLEYLHDAHGYTAAEERAYFQRAQTLPALALGLMPRLLGRDYLHLVWQSNLLDESGYGRLMLSRNLGDGGMELAAYGERSLSSHFSTYALAVLPLGDARQEFSALYRYQLSVGLKIALP